MNTKIFLFFYIFFNGIFISAMQQDCSNNTSINGVSSHYNFRQAKETDLPQLLELINTQAIHDSDKIVIVPKKFRKDVLQTAIEKKRLFVAEDHGNIVGYKKLFTIDDIHEKNEILKDEVRCIDNELNCTFAGFINEEDTFIQDESDLPDNCYNVCIYNGADFTMPSYRNKGINKHLTDYALFSLINEVKHQIEDQKTKIITMLYGVTQANAGEFPGASTDRSLRISKSFKAFLQTLENVDSSLVLQHRRYNAFMPTFDPESQELCPLPDKESIPGFGCALLYKVRKTDE